MFDPDDFSYDSDHVRPASYDDRHRATDEVTHLVFVRGRLADSWTEPARGSAYECLSSEIESERRRALPPPTPPRRPAHREVLEWLESLVGGHDALVALTDDPDPVEPLGAHLDPVGDERWLIVDERLGDALETLLPADLAAPLRRCLLLLRERYPEVVDRTTPERVAAGIVWVVGKANGTLGPTGPVVQKDVAEVLGSPALSQCNQLVYGHVRRIGWARPQPWQRTMSDLLATGRVELLGRHTRVDLVRLRDQALADEAAHTPVATDA